MGGNSTEESSKKKWKANDCVKYNLLKKNREDLLIKNRDLLFYLFTKVVFDINDVRKDP